ncbi:MAG: cation:dicarboxylate symporter family transporter [Methanothrix sp.]
MQFAFPTLSRASFFSTSKIAESSDFNLIDIFIPYNIFSSMAKGILPSIVIFSLLLGFGLIGAPKNKFILTPLDVLSSALVRVNAILKAVIPFGVFSIIVDTAGTITLNRLLEIQVFFITLIVLALLLSFLVLPLLTSSITPFSCRELLSMSGPAMILAMTSGNDFITLPLIAEGVQKLLEKQNRDEITLKAKKYSEVVLPFAYSFPNLASFSAIFFIFFTAWFYNHPLETWDRLILILAGIPGLFGSSPTLSVQFLLNLMHLPADALELFLSSYSIHIHFTTGLICMSIFSFTLICVASFTGLAVIRWKRLAISTVVIVTVFLVVILGLKIGFNHMLGDLNQDYQIIKGMDLPWNELSEPGRGPLEISVYRRLEDVPNKSASNEEVNSLKRIKSRDIIRVGYIPNIIPFSFFNRRGTLVGYDVQMACEFAQFLNVSHLVFVPVKYDSMAEALDLGYCDIIMSAVSVSSQRMEIMDLSNPYIKLNLAFVVHDWRAKEFGRLEDVQNRSDLKIAVLNSTEEIIAARMRFPYATLIRVDSFDEFFAKDNADVLLDTAEEGSAQALLHPYYTVVQLETNDTYYDFYAYPVAKSKDRSLLNILNYWIIFDEMSGAKDKKFNYWILGRGAQKTTPRWCIARDILQWMP